MQEGPLYISIEGNIGAGKTRLMNHLREHLEGVTFVDEPVDRWLSYRDAEGSTILSQFYEDKRRWAFTFQWMAMVTRHMEAQERTGGVGVALQERSVGADGHVFAKQLYENGCMTEVEWKVYTDWFDKLADLLKAKSQCMIYLRVEPETCLERIRKRGRAGEESVTLEYLKQLHDKHDDWMLRNASPTLVLHDGGSLESFTKAIREFIEHQRESS